MATAKRLPSGNYRVNLYIGNNNGKRQYKSFTATTPEEAEYLAAEYKFKNKKPIKDITVGEAVDKYINSKTNVLSPTTIQGYKSKKVVLLKDLEDIRISKLSQTTIQLWINQIALNHAPKTVKDTYYFLLTVCKVYGLSDAFYNISLPKAQKKFRDLPEPEEIFKAVKGTTIEIPVLLAMWCTMSMSEIRGAKKSCIDKNGVLTIKQVIVTVNGEFVEKENAKNEHRNRKIKLPDYIIRLIDETVESDYLTTFSGNKIYKIFRRCLDKADIQPISFHDLRHISATVMTRLGIQDKLAMERGGWASTNIMKSVYQETFSQDRINAEIAIDSYFNNIIKK